MTFASSTSDMISAIAAVLSAVVWPFVIVFLLVRFSTQIRDFVQHMAELRFSGFGVDFTAKRAQAAAALGAAEATLPKETTAEPSPPSAIAESVANATDRLTMSQITGVRVLWVDDHPENNRYERESLEAVGLIIDTATSTTEALERIASGNYPVVISDMGRKSSAENDGQAGLTLLRELRARGIMVPFIVYASSRAVRQRGEIVKAGAFGVTNQPRELFDYVLSAAKLTGAR